MLLAKNVPAGNTPLRRVDRLATVAQPGEQVIQVELNVLIALQVNFVLYLQAVVNPVQQVPMVLLVPKNVLVAMLDNIKTKTINPVVKVVELENIML